MSTPDGSTSLSGPVAAKRRSLSEQNAQVRAFWEETPCGTTHVDEAEGTDAFFADLERTRYHLEPYIPRFARFDQWADRPVLEVGFGAGTDLTQFARGRARIHGVDLTVHGAALARARTARAGLAARVMVANAEQLPIGDAQFGYVYSWGVIHHSEDTPRVAREIVRVLAPGGEICVMVYNRRSLFALKAWIFYGLLRGRPFQSLSHIIFHHIESIGTKAYTIGEAAALFPALERVTVTPVMTCHDLKLPIVGYLPRWVERLLPQSWGWFLVIRGRKPLA